jgi:hypothetical protein
MPENNLLRKYKLKSTSEITRVFGEMSAMSL